VEAASTAVPLIQRVQSIATSGSSTPKVVVLQEVSSLLPTATPLTIALATVEPTATPEPIFVLPPTSTPLPVQPVNVQTTVNVRQGPGTTYPVVGALAPSDNFTILQRNEGGDWYNITLTAGQQGWVAAFLVSNPPPPATIPVTSNYPAPPAPAPVAAAPAAGPEPAAPAPQVAPLSHTTAALEELRTCGPFDFQVYDILRVDSVWLEDTELKAEGNYLLLFVEAENIGPDSSSLRKYQPRLMARPASGEFKRLAIHERASGNAQWMYQTGSFSTELEPEDVLGLLVAYDLAVDQDYELEFMLEICPDMKVPLGLWSEVPQGHTR
jgi:hypothetical protein